MMMMMMMMMMIEMIIAPPVLVLPGWGADIVPLRSARNWVGFTCGDSYGDATTVTIIIIALITETQEAQCSFSTVYFSIL